MFISTGKYGIKWKWLQWWEMWSWGISERIQHWHPEAGSSHFWSSGLQQAAILCSSRAVEAFQVSYKSYIVNTIFTYIIPMPHFMFLNPEIEREGHCVNFNVNLEQKHFLAHTCEIHILQLCLQKYTLILKKFRILVLYQWSEVALVFKMWKSSTHSCIKVTLMIDALRRMEIWNI